MTDQEKQTVGLTFFTRFDIKNQDIGKNILSLIFETGKDFSPTKLDYGKKWRKAGENSLMSILDLWVMSDNMLFKREHQYESELAILLGKTASGFSIMSYWVDEVYFNQEIHIQNFISFAIKLYNLIHPEYGLIHQTQDKIEMATVQHPVFGPTLVPVNLDIGFPDVYWGNFFGPKNVDVIGRERLLSARCYEKLELSDGGVFLRATLSPLNPDRSREHQTELRNYLGASLFYRELNKP